MFYDGQVRFYEIENDFYTSMKSTHMVRINMTDHKTEPFTLPLIKQTGEKETANILECVMIEGHFLVLCCQKPLRRCPWTALRESQSCRTVPPPPSPRWRLQSWSRRVSSLLCLITPQKRSLNIDLFFSVFVYLSACPSICLSILFVCVSIICLPISISPFSIWTGSLPPPLPVHGMIIIIGMEYSFALPFCCPILFVNLILS